MCTELRNGTKNSADQEEWVQAEDEIHSHLGAMSCFPGIFQHKQNLTLPGLL